MFAFQLSNKHLFDVSLFQRVFFAKSGKSKPLPNTLPGSKAEGFEGFSLSYFMTTEKASQGGKKSKACQICDERHCKYNSVIIDVGSEA